MSLYMIIVVIFYVIPLIWLVWSMIDVKNGERDSVNWKGPFLLFTAVLIASIVINIYLSATYNIDFFQNSTGSIIGLVVVGFIVVVMIIINMVASLYARRKNLSKTLHDPKVVWIMTGVIGGTMLVFFLWFMPLGQKITYAVNLESAINNLEGTQKEKAFSIVLVESRSDCYRTRSNRCMDENYENVFYIRNNLDQEKEVQVKIQAQNEEKDKLKVVDSKIMKLEPGELKMVKTEETNEHSNIWGQSSFTTEKYVGYYDYNFRYRDIE